jgi:hypothetical protein
MVLPLSPIQWPSLPLPRGAAGESRQNAQLHALANQWDRQNPQVAAAIRQYIDSNWKTPVPPQVQQAVALITGQPPAVAPAYQQSPVPGNVGASLPPASGPDIWPDQPPGAGTNSPGQRPFDTSASVGTPFPGKDTGQGGAQGGFFSAPAGQGATNFSGVVDEFGRPAGQNYANTVATDQAAVAGQRAAAAQSGAQRGGNAVSGFVPDPNNPLAVAPGSKTTTPTGAFGAIDPTSAIGQQGYTQAQAGDPTALSAVLASVLGKFGIDVNRGGIFTPGLVSSLAPYLKTVMEYGGLANGGKPVIPSQLADQFGGMVGGANTFGQIQDFARNLLPTAQGLLGAPAGALADSGNQVGMVNDLLGMLTAGANPLYQQYQQGINKKTLSDYVQSQLGGPTQNYIDWMRNNAARTPGSDLLAQIIGASR